MSELSSHDRSAASVPVTLNADRNRFEAEVNGEAAAAWLDYLKIGPRFVLSHTEVPAALSGRGVGSALVQAAFEYVRQEGLQAVVVCSFARAYLNRHPEYQSLVVG
jgi:hypothetical protein